MFGLGKKDRDIQQDDLRTSAEEIGISAKSLDLSNNTEHLAAALEGSNLGFALWDPDLNLIAANPRYPDIHKIRSELLRPGINARDLMADLKVRGILTPNADPIKLAEFISHKLQTTGTLLSQVEFTDNTALEITADLLPGGNIVTFLRDASHERAMDRKWENHKTRLQSYEDLLNEMQQIISGSSPFDVITQRVADLLKVDRCVIWTGGMDTGVARSISHYNRPLGNQDEAVEFSMKTTGAFNALLSNSSILAIDDMKNHVLGLDLQDDRTYGETVKAFLAIPILENRQPVGLISCVALDQPRNWQSDEKLFLAAIAGQLPSVPKYTSTAAQGEAKQP